jgi:AraC-like DNA-binding protein
MEDELRPGDFVFVNANRMHTLRSHSGELSCYTIKILPEFLYGKEGSLFEKEYVSPVMDCDALPMYRIRPDTEHSLRMADCLMQMIALFRDEPEDYRVLIHEMLWKFWLLFLKETKDVRNRGGGFNKAEQEMIRQMLDFIHGNFQDKISLDDIAASGMISRRECSRRFRKYIHMSPNDYLNYYRLQEASGRLVQTDDSIAAISEDCGFSTVSYFGQMFKTEYGCTPREYRNRRRVQKIVI